ncbi:MAG: endonuclease MutS2, partial [Bdellovibrionota bacterium]
MTLDPEKSILILSGPNAGGKTVLLKSIGLASQMARCGLPPCVGPGSKLPFFQNILVGIGDSQSVDEDLSTFAAHLKLLSRCAEVTGYQNLLLIDEICGSTDPEEGAALAKSFIRRFSANHVFAVITSHLGFLKSGWKDSDPVVNGSLEYDSRSSKPTYHFLQGIPGDSLALLTAERVGIDADIIAKAKDYLSPAKRAQIDELKKIEELRRD